MGVSLFGVPHGGEHEGGGVRGCARSSGGAWWLVAVRTRRRRAVVGDTGEGTCEGGGPVRGGLRGPAWGKGKWPYWADRLRLAQRTMQIFT
jgi:hypothetical protein